MIEKTLTIPESILKAENMSYDNSNSGLNATDTQAAIDEIQNQTLNALYFDETLEISGPVATPLTTQHIVDNVESDASNKVLSAKQGKVLNARISNIITNNNDTDGNDELVDMRVDVDGVLHDSAGDAVRSQVSKLSSEIVDINSYIGIEWIFGGHVNQNGELVTPSTKRYYTPLIPCGGNVTIKYKAETNHPNISGLTCYDRNKNVIATNSNIGETNTEYTFITPLNTMFVRLSGIKDYDMKVTFESSPLSSVVENLAAKKENANIAYVSIDGDDSNNGTKESPFATVNKAFENGASVILVSEGIYEQNIDVSKSNHSVIEIKNISNNGRVIFREQNSLLANNESKVSGYEKVYSANISKSFSEGNRWIFQENINDLTTLISDSERHSLQRGYEYRCPDTKIEKCSATVLSDALSEIDNADIYKWFYDSENNILYFSRPQEVNESYSLRGSFGNSLFKNTERKHTLKLFGIETKYLIFNITNTTNSLVKDCKACNVLGGGAFVYDNSIGGVFEKCEAVRCFAGDNGDGFNAHSQKIGDEKAKHTTASLIDCWSHDNNDDGYSDHERSEITIIGGLFEYNKKGGVTPAYGSHCTCYNVLSRNNFCGFNCLGSVASDEGGKYTQMICYNCVAMNNTGGTRKSGFAVSGENNSMTLIGCKSINNTYGFESVENTNIATLIDCTACGNAKSVKNGYGVFNITNTEKVE